MINLLLPGFLTKGLPRLKLLFDHTPSSFDHTPSSFFRPLPAPHHYHPKSREAFSVFLIAQQGEGAGDWRPEAKGGRSRPLEACASKLCYKCLNRSQQHPPTAPCHTECRKVLWLLCVQSERSPAESPLQQTKQRPRSYRRSVLCPSSWEGHGFAPICSAELRVSLPPSPLHHLLTLGFGL